MTDRPGLLNGLRHLALVVPNLEECERFYVEMLGMRVLHRAHADLVYLTCGNDNLSLGRLKPGEHAAGTQLMDHLGFIVDTKQQLDAWYDYLEEKGVPIVNGPHDHKDGARSFYCLDPAGNKVQPLYHPAVSGQRFSGPEGP
jgi:catechol 2,3-dioxygenase-like lactoylglutathione lyase family enzyme